MSAPMVNVDSGEDQWTREKRERGLVFATVRHELEAVVEWLERIGEAPAVRYWLKEIIAAGPSWIDRPLEGVRP